MVSGKVTNFIKTLHMNRVRGIRHIPVRTAMETVRVIGRRRCRKMGEDRQGDQRKFLRREYLSLHLLSKSGQ